LVLPRGLIIGGTDILGGATSIQTLKIHEQLWESSFKPSFDENLSGFIQLVQFYGDSNIIETLETERDMDLVGDGRGYQKVIDYYLGRDTFTVDRTGGTNNLVRSGKVGLTYTVNTSSLSTGIGIYDGVLTIVGSGGQLTQTLVDSAILAHTSERNGLRPLHTLIVGDKFTSLSRSLSLKGTGIVSLYFPAESPITTTGTFELTIDNTVETFVVLPKWVTQQGPWSL
jgi:hypothetical protein